MAHAHPSGLSCSSKILQKKLSNEDSSTDVSAANLVDTNGDDHSTTQVSLADEESSNADPSPNLHALLASAMNLVTDNDVVRDYIAEAINAASTVE